MQYLHFRFLLLKKELHNCYNYSVEKYYELFSCNYSSVEIWQTNYFHQMNAHEEIVEFVKGTALLPYLNCLNEIEREAFLNLVLQNVIDHYKPSPNQKILFEFKRIFVLASK